VEEARVDLQLVDEVPAGPEKSRGKTAGRQGRSKRRKS